MIIVLLKCWSHCIYHHSVSFYSHHSDITSNVNFMKVSGECFLKHNLTNILVDIIVWLESCFWVIDHLKDQEEFFHPLNIRIINFRKHLIIKKIKHSYELKVSYVPFKLCCSYHPSEILICIFCLWWKNLFSGYIPGKN